MPQASPAAAHVRTPADRVWPGPPAPGPARPTGLLAKDPRRLHRKSGLASSSKNNGVTLPPEHPDTPRLLCRPPTLYPHPKEAWAWGSYFPDESKGSERWDHS